MKLRISCEPCFWFIATKTYAVLEGDSNTWTAVISPLCGYSILDIANQLERDSLTDGFCVALASYSLRDITAGLPVLAKMISILR